MDTLRIGNAQGFWGDADDAPLRLATEAPDLDFLTLDYLAEVSLSILARQHERDPTLGYAREFIGVIESLAPIWKSGRRLRLVTNAGGLNPPRLLKPLGKSFAPPAARSFESASSAATTYRRRLSPRTNPASQPSRSPTLTPANRFKPSWTES